MTTLTRILFINDHPLINMLPNKECVLWTIVYDVNIAVGKHIEDYGTLAQSS